MSFAGRRQTLATRPRPDGACTVFLDPDIHEIKRSFPTPELSSINVTLQILASTTSEVTLADGEKAFMQGDPRVRDEPLYATPPPEGLPGVPEGALIRLDREVYGLVSGMSGWRSRSVSQLKEEGYEMNVYEPCFFRKFGVREEPAVDGGSTAPGEFIGCVLLEVEDHLMGGPGKAHHYVYVFDIGSININGKELLRQFTFHQKIQVKIAL